MTSSGAGSADAGSSLPSRPAATISPLAGRVAQFTGGRIIVLDVLRAVAVFLVLGSHLDILPVALEGGPLRTFLATWQRGGGVGVDIFFVLSGFLVSSLLFREYQLHRSVRIGRFLIRRGLKIYPAFYLVILTTLWLDLVPYGNRGLVGELLFLQNYVGWIWPHTWTLAVEEHFYLALACLVWWLVRRNAGRDPFAVIPALTAVLALTCFVARVATWHALPFGDFTHLFPTHLRLDSLLFGVLLSYLFHTRPDSCFAFFERNSRLCVVLGVVALSLAFVLPHSSFVYYTLGLTLIYLGSGLMLCGLMVGWQSPGPVARAVAWWGGFSYSVYLWHMPIVVWVRHATMGTGSGPNLVAPWSIWIYLVAASALGVVFAKLVELPVLRLRDALIPSRS